MLEISSAQSDIFFMPQRVKILLSGVVADIPIWPRVVVYLGVRRPQDNNFSDEVIILFFILRPKQNCRRFAEDVLNKIFLTKMFKFRRSLFFIFQSPLYVGIGSGDDLYHCVSSRWQQQTTTFCILVHCAAKSPVVTLTEEFNSRLVKPSVAVFITLG